MIENSEIGRNTQIWHTNLVNIYGCTIGEACSIGSFVEIGKEVVIGDRCRIGSFSFIPEGVMIGKDVFIGPRVTFLNDKHPPSKGKWRNEAKTLVEDEVSIGGGAIILPHIILGFGCRIGAGAVVTKDVAPGVTVVGNPAKILVKAE